VLLFVVDASVDLGGGDRYIADLLQSISGPIVLGLNKIDQQAANDRTSIEIPYLTLANQHGWGFQRFSALTGEGLEALQADLIQRLELGPYYYPPDLVTDQPERFIMGELIREQILLQTREEIPHSVAISVDQVQEDPDITRIFATIHVERDSQKGIVIGKGGSMIKAIGTAAREQIQKLIAGKVHLELFVKVLPRWRQSRVRLAELGYRVEE
jgi:GTP-binding protein Era